MLDPRANDIFLEIAPAFYAENNLFFQNGGPPRFQFGPTVYGLNDLEGTLNAGRNNRAGDPLFLDPSAGNFVVQAASPAVDSGSADVASVCQAYLSLYGVDIAKDAAGTSRPLGAGWDMGAYEKTSVLTFIKGFGKGGSSPF